MAILRQGASKKWDKKNVFFQKRTGEVVEYKGSRSKNEPKTNRNEPKNEAEKLLKTQDCIKNEPKTNRNEPKNEPGHVVENKWPSKIELKSRLSANATSAMCFCARRRPAGRRPEGPAAGPRSVARIPSSQTWV
jgi:hypothetical protein